MLGIDTTDVPKHYTRMNAFCLAMANESITPLLLVRNRLKIFVIDEFLRLNFDSEREPRYDLSD
jgi:hypothetical protein